MGWMHCGTLFLGLRTSPSGLICWFFLPLHSSCSSLGVSCLRGFRCSRLRRGTLPVKIPVFPVKCERHDSHKLPAEGARYSDARRKRISYGSCGNREELPPRRVPRRKIKGCVPYCRKYGGGSGDCRWPHIPQLLWCRHHGGRGRSDHSSRAL